MGILSHGQTILKSAHFYLQQHLEAQITNLLVLPLFIKRRQKLDISTNTYMWLNAAIQASRTLPQLW
jgi:hypothetical protein